MNKREMIKQRLNCLGLIIIGIISSVIAEGDATFLVFISLIAVPGLFTKDRIFYYESDDEFES